MRPEEIVEVRVNGNAYTGWADVKVTAGLDEAARTFELSIVASGSNDQGARSEFLAWPIKVDDDIEVRLGGVTAVKGVVDARQGVLTFKDTGLQVSGRSKTRDAIDSSVDEPGGEFKDVRLDALAKRLYGKHGINVKVEGDVGKPFPVVRIQPGETTHELIDRLARARGLILTDDDEGNLVLKDEGDKGSGEAYELIEGFNILGIRATHRADNQFKKVKVKGQRPRVTDEDEDADEDDENGLDDVEAEAENADATRERTLVIVSEEPGDKDAMKDRAGRELAKRAAEGIEATVTLQGFHKAPGKLWAPGDKVFVRSPAMQLAREMVVKQVSWAQDFDNGSTTELDLCPPEAVKKPKKGKSSGGKDDKGKGESGSSSSSPASASSSSSSLGTLEPGGSKGTGANRSILSNAIWKPDLKVTK